jgi:hypothetical protein
VGKEDEMTGLAVCCRSFLDADLSLPGGGLLFDDRVFSE